MWAVGGVNCAQLNSSMCQNVANSNVPVNTRLPQTIQRSRIQSGSRATLRKNSVRKMYPAPMNAWAYLRLGVPGEVVRHELREHEHPCREPGRGQRAEHPPADLRTRWPVHPHLPAPGPGDADDVYASRTSSASTISGRRTVNVVSPTSLSTEMCPPCCSTMCRVPASPMPLPLTVPAVFDAR